MSMAMKEFNPADFSILLVDDNPKNLQLLANLLSQAKYNFEFAPDGIKALEWIKKKAFDLILLDIMMPHMDGFEVCRRIRKQPKFNDLPILFLTAKLDEESIIKGLESGAQDYISKPFKVKELFARIKTHLELKESKEKLKEINKWLEEKVRERTIELRKANEQLAAANEELMGLDNAKTEFLSIISHEIRTPLNGIIPVFRLLKDHITDAEDKELVSILNDSVSRLERFTRLALLIAELRTEKYRINKIPINLNEIIDLALNKLDKGIREKNISIDRSQIPAKIVLVADYRLISECVICILNNAIKYSENNRVVKVAAYEDNGSIVCDITDQGPGFSEKALKNLFKFFSPGDDHTGQNEGMELATAKLIMDLHKGKIKVQNNKPKGANVTLLFP